MALTIWEFLIPEVSLKKFDTAFGLVVILLQKQNIIKIKNICCDGAHFRKSCAFRPIEAFRDDASALPITLKLRGLPNSVSI